MKVSEQETRHVAALARIELKEDEVSMLTEQLTNILDFVSKINELDTTDVKETSHTLDVENVFHLDENKPSLSQSQAVSMAADKENGYFKVPPIIE